MWSDFCLASSGCSEIRITLFRILSKMLMAWFDNWVFRSGPSLNLLVGTMEIALAKVANVYK